MFCFFKSKEKPVIEDNDYSRHLPPSLYLFLRDHQLLENESREFSYTSPSGTPATATFEIETRTMQLYGYDGFLSLRIHRHEDKKYMTDLFQFSNKMWLLSFCRDGSAEAARGYEGYSSYMNDAYDKKKCIRLTPVETALIVKRLQKFMSLDKKSMQKLKK